MCVEGKRERERKTEKKKEYDWQHKLDEIYRSVVTT